MSDTESVDYLQTGFDPTSLTVPRLRSILVQHNVAYPSSAKKTQLIDIFNENILPQSRKILNARARARRTSKGITDADSQDTVMVEEDVPQATPKARTARRSTRAVTNESESEGGVGHDEGLRSPVKKAGRTPRPSSKHARTSDTETGTDPDGVKKSVRKTRRSETPAAAHAAPAQLPAPRIKLEDIDDGAGVSRRESAFTYDNPFQSGSSPLSDSRVVSGEKKRKSVGTSARKSTAIPMRRTDVAQADEGIHPPSSATFDPKVSKLNGLRDFDENGVEASEEFTPEEQLELVRERSAKGVNAIVPRRPKKKTQGTGKAAPIWLGLLTLLGGYAAWYRQEKLAVGYCGVGRDAHQIVPAGVQVPDWVKTLAEPQCELCPPHAYCSGNLETTCEADFVLKPHSLSFNGLIPLPPTCEPDGEKVRKVKAVADRAVEELRERRAKFECGELKDEEGTPLPIVEIDAEELKSVVSKKRRKGMGEAEFEDLWTGAIGEIRARDEVVSSDGHPPSTLLLTSTSLSRLPLLCSLQRSVRLSLARHRLQISILIALSFLTLYIRHLFTTRAATSAAIPQLVSLTLDRLATQAALHAQDKEAYPEPWISVGQLRDDVLRDEHSVRRREEVWRGVRRVVELNANVRASQREGRSGEVSRVWEWIGAVAGVDGERRRKSGGRVSWGAVYDERSSPVGGVDGGSEGERGRWEEGRPIY